MKKSTQMKKATQKKKNFFKQDQVIYFQLGLIFLAALILRFSPMLWSRDFWYDEAFTGILLKSSWGEMNQMIFADVHPPLYYWLAKPVSALFGYSSLGIRFFSVLMSLATLISLFWVGKKMFSPRTGLLAVLFLAFSPFAIEYAQEARMYSLFGFLMLWAVWFFYQALEKNRRQDWIFWGILAGLAFLTHYLSLFFFVIFYLVFVAWRIIFDRKIWWRAFLGEKGFWLGVGTIGVFFLGWLKFFITHMLKGNLGWIDVTYLSVLPSTIQIFLFGHPPGTGGVPTANAFRGIFDGSSIGLLVLIGGLVLLTLNWQKNQKRKELFLLSGLSLGTLVFVALLSHLNIKLYVSRYFMPSALLIYLFLAGSLLSFFPEKKAWLWTAFFFALLLAFLKPISFASDWNQIAKLQEEGLIDKESIFITSGPFDYATARYYFGEENVRYYNRSNPEEDFSGWVVVGNENRISNIEELKTIPQAVVVNGSCWWLGVNLEEIFRTEKMSVCRIKD